MSRATRLGSQTKEKITKRLKSPLGHASNDAIESISQDSSTSSAKLSKRPARTPSAFGPHRTREEGPSQSLPAARTPPPLPTTPPDRGKPASVGSKASPVPGSKRSFDRIKSPGYDDGSRTRRNYSPHHPALHHGLYYRRPTQFSTQIPQLRHR